jgi:predicted RNA-binding protein with TRAM domain
VTIKIESIAFGGQGVGRVNNFVVFIPLPPVMMNWKLKSSN